MYVMTTITVVLLAVFVLIGIPIAVAIGLASVAVLLFSDVVPLLIIPQLFSEASTSFVMLAIPLFILAGNLMERGTIGKNLMNFVNSCFGWMTGGLGTVNMVQSMVFGGTSGSSLADTAVECSILVPRMVELKYPKSYAAACTLASSCLSVIIPPSINIILIASVTQQSITKSLAAGIVPGVLVTFMLCVPNYFISKKRGYGEKIKFSVKNVLSTFKQTWSALAAPLIVLGSIFTGIVTPTEAAAVLVIYIILIDGILYRKLKLRDFIDSLKESAKLTSSILFIATSSAVLNWILAYENIPNLLASSLVNIPGGRYGFMLMFILIMILLGSLMDGTIVSEPELGAEEVFEPALGAEGVLLVAVFPQPTTLNIKTSTKTTIENFLNLIFLYPSLFIYKLNI
jgi:tripartite ATP-independent transporter DctM subunit